MFFSVNRLNSPYAAFSKIRKLLTDVTPLFSPSFRHKPESGNIKELQIHAFSGMSGKSPFPVIPMKTGIQLFQAILDTDFRRYDGGGVTSVTHFNRHSGESRTPVFQRFPDYDFRRWYGNGAYGA